MSKEDELIKKVIDTYVSRNGYSDVRANLDGFEAPPALTNTSGDEQLIPDITASRRGGKWYIEVVRKDADPEKTVSKWKLLSIIGKAKGGGLVLLSPSGSFAFADRLTKKHDIQAQIIKM